MSEEQVTYEVETVAGEWFRFTVPASYKVTFGPLGVGSKGYGGMEIVLRVYEDAAKERQRALFKDVKSFRDVTIPVLYEAHRRKGVDKDWFDPNDPYGPLKDFRGQIETDWRPREEIISSGRSELGDAMEGIAAPSSIGKATW